MPGQRRSGVLRSIAIICKGLVRCSDRFQASDVAFETDAAGNLKPSKKKSTERIDGIVAGVMALGRSMLHQPQTSIYETRGLISV